MVKSISLHLFAFSLSVVCIHAMEQLKLVDCKNAAYWTPLHTAASLGNVEQTKALLAFGARIDSRALPNNRTPLMFSAEHGKNAIADLLLKNGSIVDQTDLNHKTALHIACEKGHCEVVETLVLAGASTAVAPAFGNTGAIYYALAYKDYGDPSVLVALQKAIKKKSDFENAAQGFSLHRACQEGNIEDIKKLLAEGAKLDHERDKSGNCILHYAAAHTNPEILTTILDSLKKNEPNTAIPVSLPSASLQPSNGNSPSTGSFGPRDMYPGE